MITQKRSVMKNIISTALLLILCMVSYAAGSTTKFWRLSTFEDFKKNARTGGVVLSSSGELRGGASFEKLETGQIGVWSMVETEKGNLYVGTGNQGVILKKENGEVKNLFTSEDQLLVTDLVRASDGTVYAGTVPGKKEDFGRARIYRILPEKEKVSSITNISGAYIWDLEIGPDGQLYVATSPEGKIYTVSKDGEVELLYETEQDHVMSLAVSDRGTLYAGTGMRGRLFRITEEGDADVLYDFEEQEVRVLDWADGRLYVGTNKLKNFRPKSFVKRLRRAVKKFRKGEKSDPALGKLMEGAVYRLSPEGSIFPLHRFENQYITDMKRDGEGHILLSTGERGRLFRLDPNTRSYELLMDFEGQQAQDILLNKEQQLSFVGTANPGVVYDFRPQKEREVQYESRVFDAKYIAKYGEIQWGKIGEGNIRVQTRSGNSSQPDKHWSDWSAPMKSSGEAIQSPRGRYFQFRISWPAGSDAVLKWIHIPYLPENQQPYFEKIQTEANNNTRGFQGETKEHSSVTLSWSAEDPDQDQLVYRIWARRIGAEKWFSLTPNGAVSKNRYKWETGDVQNGQYEVKVEASDERENPQKLAHRSVIRTAPVLVDNERPSITSLEMKQGNQVSGTATDQYSMIARIEYRVDGGDWQLVFPDDQIFDEKQEEFSFSIPSFDSDGHQFTIRVFDAAGNTIVRQEVITPE